MTVWTSIPLACACWSLPRWSTRTQSAGMLPRSTGRCPRCAQDTPCSRKLDPCLPFTGSSNAQAQVWMHVCFTRLHGQQLCLSNDTSCTFWLQGILPAGLAKVPTGELAEFISVCIAPRQHRPRARHLLKHPYFHTIRAEKAAVKLGAEALAHSVSCAADLHQMVADCAASVAGSVSRTSSELAEVCRPLLMCAQPCAPSPEVPIAFMPCAHTVMGDITRDRLLVEDLRCLTSQRWGLQVQHVLTSTPLDSSRHGPFAESRAAQPLRDELPEGQQLTEQSHSMPLVDHPAVWRPDPLLEKPEGVSPPHSEPGRNEFGDRDGAESWATVRTARDSFETASTSHAHMQERCMSECSERDDQQPVLTGTMLLTPTGCS